MEEVAAQEAAQQNLALPCCIRVVKLLYNEIHEKMAEVRKRSIMACASLLLFRVVCKYISLDLFAGV